MSSAPHPFRQIHLDFHTSPHIPGVGARFEADRFADTLLRAGVNSITLFAKCHHGHLYYDTASPARHPTLRRNLLEEQIDVLHRHGIRTPIYISVQCDEYAADTHPEWIAINSDGTHVGRKPLTGELYQWQILDMSSPYVDYLADQITEVMQKFQPVDGIFLDMCWEQPSASRWAKAGMRARGLDPAVAADRDRYASQVTEGYLNRYSALIGSFQPDVPIWFNVVPLSRMWRDKHLLRHIEIEALPSGQWGYAFLPVNIRYARPMGLPLVAMTGRFHKTWADFGGLRTVPSLTYDCGLALAHGAACSVGDQLHPSGTLDPGAYEIIGATYAYVEQCEPWCRDAVAPLEIAVLHGVETAENQAGAVAEGVMRALSQLRYQFAYLDVAAAWEAYPLVIVPGSIAVDDALRARLQACEDGGGAVLHEDLTGEASPFTATYLRFAAGALGTTLPQSDHVFYERGVRRAPQAGEEVLAQIVEPYFERTWDRFCSHAQTPNLPDASPYAAAVLRGRRVTFSLPVFRAYADHGNIACRQLVAAAVERLLPNPLLRSEAPSYVDAVVNDIPGRRVVHLLSYVPQKRARTQELIEEAVPARDVLLDIRIEAPVERVALEPAGRAVDFEQFGGRCRVKLDWIEGHQMVVIYAKP